MALQAESDYRTMGAQQLGKTDDNLEDATVFSRDFAGVHLMTTNVP
jgi:hypothetical protein